MLLSQLLKKIEYCGSFTDTEVEHITNSSFEAREHSVFVCIRGFATDGHVFAPKAYDAGCRIFVCERQPEGLPSDATVNWCTTADVPLHYSPALFTASLRAPFQ